LKGDRSTEEEEIFRKIIDYTFILKLAHHVDLFTEMNQLSLSVLSIRIETSFVG
jgi:hypothetical protein